MPNHTQLQISLPTASPTEMVKPLLAYASELEDRVRILEQRNKELEERACVAEQLHDTTTSTPAAILIQDILDFASKQTDPASVCLLQNLMYRHAKGDAKLIELIDNIKPYSEPKFSNIGNLTLGDRVAKKYAN